MSFFNFQINSICTTSKLCQLAQHWNHVNLNNIGVLSFCNFQINSMCATSKSCQFEQHQNPVSFVPFSIPFDESFWNFFWIKFFLFFPEFFLFTRSLTRMTLSSALSKHLRYADQQILNDSETKWYRVLIKNDKIIGISSQ